MGKKGKTLKKKQGNPRQGTRKEFQKNKERKDGGFSLVGLFLKNSLKRLLGCASFVLARICLCSGAFVDACSGCARLLHPLFGGHLTPVHHIKACTCRVLVSAFSAFSLRGISPDPRFFWGETDLAHFLHFLRIGFESLILKIRPTSFISV